MDLKRLRTFVAVADLGTVPKSSMLEIQEAVSDCAESWLRPRGRIPPSIPQGDPPPPGGIMNQMYGITAPQDMKTFLEDMRDSLRAKQFDFYKMNTSNSNLLKLCSKSLAEVEAYIGANTRDLAGGVRV